MTANNNDKNWSQMRETVLLINVAVARIEHAMNEGDDSFTNLSQSFVEIVDSAKQITQSSAQLEDSAIKSAIDDSCQDISQRVKNSIVAFQFYDKLSQRMALVSKTLNSLTEILKDTDKTDVQDEWIKLQNVIRSKYTLDADQQMFDDVLNGMPIKEALEAAVNKTTEDDIEFF
ncbi:MAG: hypothetical protein BMS9Abin31_0613 [Gammaproteobacteria bacterium]|nr:MAG: hypothetical protein BMS9Abin31_0613 [Gammaproteobacteria bacterium]